MNLPKTLKVGAHTLRIEDWDPAEADSRGRLGEVQRLRGLIRIDTSYGDAHTADTFLHEILHCAYTQQGLEPGDDEERIVNALAKGLCALIFDNPDAFQEILKALAPTKKSSVIERMRHMNARGIEGSGSGLLHDDSRDDS